MLQLIYNEITSTTVQFVVGTLLGGAMSFLVQKYQQHQSIEDKIEVLTNVIEQARSDFRDEIKQVRSDFRDEIKQVRSDLLVEINNLKKAESASLRNTIRFACKNRLRDGWVSIDEKSDILNCYDAYEMIVDSNGVIDDLVTQLRELPIENPKGVSRKS